MQIHVARRTRRHHDRPPVAVVARVGEPRRAQPVAVVAERVHRGGYVVPAATGFGGAARVAGVSSVRAYGDHTHCSAQVLLPSSVSSIRANGSSSLLRVWRPPATQKAWSQLKRLDAPPPYDG